MNRREIGEAEFKALAHLAAGARLFAPLKGVELDRLLSRIGLYSFEPGEAVYKRGDPAQAFYMIYEGRVRVHLKRRLFGLLPNSVVLGPGAFFGEMALLENRRRSKNVVVEASAKLFVFLREDFESLVRDNAEFAKHIRELAYRRKFETPR